MYWCMHCGKRYCAQCSHIFHAPGTTNALLHTGTLSSMLVGSPALTLSQLVTLAPAYGMKHGTLRAKGRLQGSRGGIQNGHMSDMGRICI